MPQVRRPQAVLRQQALRLRAEALQLLRQAVAWASKASRRERVAPSTRVQSQLHTSRRSDAQADSTRCTQDKSQVLRR